MSDKEIVQVQTKKYSIALHGCDDSTLMEMELTAVEAELLERVAKLSQETSAYGCMPTLEIEEVEDGPSA